MKTNWQTKKLGEVCTFQRGLTYTKKDEVVDSSNIVLRANNIDLNTNSLNLTDLKYINEKINIPDSKKVKKGSLLICTASGSKKHLGKIALIDTNNDYAFGGFMGQLTPKDEIDSKYLFYLLTSDSYRKLIDGLTNGVNINNLRFDSLSLYQIPVPTLAEQKRIVKILDEVFEGIEKAKKNTEKNLANAKELFESYLQSVFARIGDDWEASKLVDIAQITSGYSFKSKDFKSQGTYQVIRMGNVRPGHIRISENPVYINEMDQAVLNRALLLPNDVIITQTGTKKKRDYGYTAIIEERNLLLNQRISSIRFSESFLPKFFLYYSWTDLFKNQFFADERGTVGQGNVGIGAIQNAIVPFPPLSKQESIVAKLEALSEQTKKLESIYQQKMDALEELKKSVLNKAFAGEL